MEVQGSYGRILQGVSQQPPAVRLPGQVTAQLNAVPNVVDGLKTRMGSKHIARILDNLDPNSMVHHYKRGDDNEEYLVILRPNSTPIIYTMAGQACVVNVQGTAASYLSTAALPRETVQLMTIGDYTFVLNRKTVVQARGNLTPGLDNQGLVYVAYANYSFTYQILINGRVAASFKTVSSEKVENEDKVRTDYVAGQLIADFNTNHAGSFPGFSMVQNGNVIQVNNTTGAAYSLTTIDGADGQDLVSIRHKVANLDLLPNRAPVGYKVQVWATGSQPESRYWLQAEEQDGGKVTWKETIAPGVRLGWNTGTMPHVLVRESVNSAGIATFTYRPGEWEDRDVGDDLTNAFPSLWDPDSGGQAISSMLMVQNRLMLTSGEAVVASRTSRFFDFFRYTVLTTLDTDPFDVFADIEEVYNIRWSAQMDGDVALFTSEQQFILPGDKPLTPTSAVIRPVTNFKMTPGVQPQPSGDSILFAFDSGSYSGIREFFTDSYSDTKKAQPATSHVDKYIQGKVLELTASSSFNRAFIITARDRDTLYVYDWLYEGVEKVQNAWHKWKFPAGTVLHSVTYSNEKLYLILTRTSTNGGTGVFLEVMDMGDELEYGLVDRVRMDRRGAVTMNYNSGTKVWTSNPLPWRPQELDGLDAVITSGWPAYIGANFLFTYDQTNNTISSTFDIASGSTATVIVGESYWFEVEPTPPLIKDSKDRVSYLEIPTVGNVYLNCDLYPDFSVRVTDKETLAVKEVYLSNKVAGQLNNVVGYVTPHEGTLRVPIRRKSTDVTYAVRVRSPGTFQLRDIEWTGSYNPRKRRV